MIGKARLYFVFAIMLAGLVLGLQGRAHAIHKEVSEDTLDLLSRASQAMVEVVEAIKPSVVNISTTRTVRRRGAGGVPFDDPMFRRFFGEDFARRFQEPEERDVTSLGSGVIVAEDGYIVTNNHVIRDADEIKVTLFDKREFTGKVIGTDPKTDIAVIKIDATGLPALEWGDSDRLRVGETVIAVGIPFGLDHTVTSGIVSAKGRANVRIAEYEDFIQTDAAINPGNSGGPLVNVRGELVGINTAIFSVTGGYQGIGFAIPSNMAKLVLQSLITEGKVVRGWLGVTVQPITEELARQFGLSEMEGILVSDVTEGGPAEAAGIKRGDVILKYDGKKAESPLALRNMVAATRPDTEVELLLAREGEKIALGVEIGELPSAAKEVSGGIDNALSGTHVQDITPEISRSLGLPERLKGVLVTDVEERNGLQRGDVIMEINRQKVTSVKEYAEVASNIPADSEILLLIYRNGSVIYITVSLEG
jgi:serine protease Do